MIEPNNKCNSNPRSIGSIKVFIKVKYKKIYISKSKNDYKEYSINQQALSICFHFYIIIQTML